MIKVNIDMPKCCNDCPFFDGYETQSGQPVHRYGECKLLEIKDLDDKCIKHQTVNAFYREIPVEVEDWNSEDAKNKQGRSVHCPLEEIKDDSNK